MVPLPKDTSIKQIIGESTSQAVRRILSLERSLNARDCFEEFNDVIQEYLDLGHVEMVAIADLKRQQIKCFIFLCMRSTKPRVRPLPCER